MSSSRATASSGSSRMKLKNFISWRTPKGPPSWLAPLSAIRTMTVSSKRSSGLQGVEQAPDLDVGVVEEGRERLLQPAGEAPVVLGQVVPGLDPGVAGRQLGLGGDDAELLLAGEPALPGHVPALVVTPAVLLEVLGGGLVGGVGGPEGQVGEERPVRPDGDRVVEEADGLVDQVLAEVVALLGRRRRLDGVVVVDQLGGELVGLAVQEPVEAVEAPLQRPLVVGPGGGGLLHRAQVPLAEAQGRVALGPQHLGHRRRVVGDPAPHVGVAGAEVGDRPHAHRVVVAAGEQGRPGRRAQRRHVEVGELETTGRQAVDVRGVDVGAVAAQVGEPEVVEDDDHDVGGGLSRVRCRRPPRGRLGLVPGDLALEGLVRAHRGAASTGRGMAPITRTRPRGRRWTRPDARGQGRPRPGGCPRGPPRRGPPARCREPGRSGPGRTPGHRPR